MKKKNKSVMWVKNLFKILKMILISLNMIFNHEQN